MTYHEEQLKLRQRGKRALWVSLGLTFSFMICEFLGGIASHSLALIADAAHMLTDVVGLGLALFAFWMVERPPTQRMSYGFHRAEILAALANGVILVNMVIYIFLESFKRLQSPPHVLSGIMLTFAFIGFLVNLLSAWNLKNVKSRNLNIQGAFFHVVSDLLGSVGVLLAGLALRFFHWPYADPCAGILIGCLIIASAWKLLRDSISILLEAAPVHIDLEILEKAFLSVEGVKDVHDLHVWSISSGKEALSAHLNIREDAEPNVILTKLNSILEEQFGIFHSTIQLETASLPGHSSSF